jgi:hypothetical protein
LLYRRFVGLGIDEAVWVPTALTKDPDRLLEAEVARGRGFDAGVSADEATLKRLPDTARH